MDLTKHGASNILNDFSEQISHKRCTQSHKSWEYFSTFLPFSSSSKRQHREWLQWMVQGISFMRGSECHDSAATDNAESKKPVSECGGWECCGPGPVPGASSGARESPWPGLSWSQQGQAAHTHTSLATIHTFLAMVCTLLTLVPLNSSITQSLWTQADNAIQWSGDD